MEELARLPTKQLCSIFTGQITFLAFQNSTNQQLQNSREGITWLIIEINADVIKFGPVRHKMATNQKHQRTHYQLRCFLHN